METLGVLIYDALAAKTSDHEAVAIYRRLSLNEAETARHIATELVALDAPTPAVVNFILKGLASALFCLFSCSLLDYLLRRTLRRKMFRLWFGMYHARNATFWQAMLDHEALQIDLLKL